MTTILTPGRHPPKLAAATALLFLFTGLALICQLRNAPVGDFANYYYASRLLLEGKFDRRVYDPSAYNQIVSQRSGERLFVNYTPVPPANVLFYLPFGLPEDIRFSKLLFNLLGLLAFCLTVFLLLRRHAFLNSFWNLSLPFVFAMPLLNNFYQGQSYLWILAFLAGGLLQWQSGRRFAAALLWALPAALKLFPAPIILLPLLHGDRRTAVLSAVFAAVFSILPLAVMEPAIVAGYFTHLAPRLLRGEINDPFTILYQSARVLIDRLFIFDQHLNPQPLRHWPMLAAWLMAFYRVGILLAGVWLLRAAKGNHLATLGILLLTTMLLTGYGSSYGFLLLMPLALALPGWTGKSEVILVSFLLLGMGANVPVYQLNDWPWWLQFPRLFALLGCMALLALYCRPQLPPTPAVAIATLISMVILLGLPGRPRPEGTYYLPDSRFGIIYDYRVDEGFLELFFFNQDGDQSWLLPLRDHIYPDPGLRVIKRQIYFEGRQLTHTNSRKRRPHRLNEQEVLYLSDEGRGPGFYTLRRIRMP